MEKCKHLSLFWKIRGTLINPAKETNQLVINLNNAAVRFLGMDVLDMKFSFVNPRFIFLLSIMFSFLYADIEAAVLAEDFGELIYNLAVLGLGIQGFAKFDAYIFKKLKMYTLINELLRNLEEFQKHVQYREIFLDSITFVMVFKKLYIYLYGGFGVVCFSFGILVSLYTGTLALTFGFQFSFLSTSGWVGYLLTYLYQTAAIVAVIVSSYCNDLGIVFMISSILALYDCIISDLRDLDGLCMVEEPETVRSDIEMKIKRIIQKHQILIKYVNQFNSTYSVYFFLSLVCLTGVMAMSLVALIWTSWYPGIVFCVVASFQIFSLCLLGTLLSLKCEELCKECYRVSWYMFGVRSQKSVKFLLMMAQNYKNISYHFGQMNMQTFVKAHKLVYSLFTMLVASRR
ncbi:putative odorant receptor 83c [Uranotaenia lowii]|uniref:putative odorant receptor 83c n=1 Tax=Uranotaenia lowii TaxID=190385 RepID=UPI002478791D|nr:putative odorant receptor 83c [Uranotaenia lowii]